MTSRATPRFWAAYRELSPEVRDLARKAYRLFRDNPKHPSLQFKKVHDREPIYSVRVTLAFRAVGVLKGDESAWFWIGGHADYDRLLKALQPSSSSAQRSVSAAAARDRTGRKRLLAGEPERRINRMTKPMTSVLADALRLDDDARAELAAELLASLDGPADPDAEQAWDAEIERRIDAIEAGHIALESWDEVRRRIERDILGR